ncbi:pyrroloquinoline quinone precursor peptide PqqA [Azospirillum sp. A1-3]
MREEAIMTWVKPAYCDLRLGFEVTAYVYVR